MVDISECEYRNAVDDYNQINGELKKYSAELAGVPQIVVATKSDLLLEEELEEKLKLFEEKTGKRPMVISSIMHMGVNELLDKIVEVLSKTPKKAPIDIELHDFDVKDKTSLEIIKREDGAYEVVGGFIDNLIRGVVLSDEQSNAYFQNALKKFGIIEKLKEAGMQDGDTVVIKDISFDYQE